LVQAALSGSKGPACLVEGASVAQVGGPQAGSLRYFAGAGRRVVSWKLTLLCRRLSAGRKLEAYATLPVQAGGPQA